MRDENKPALEVRFVGVRRQTGELTCRLKVAMRTGDDYTARTWNCPTGRPDAGQADDMAAEVAQTIVELLVATCGLQGLIPG